MQSYRSELQKQNILTDFEQLKQTGRCKTLLKATDRESSRYIWYADPDSGIQTAVKFIEKKNVLYPRLSLKNQADAQITN